jgi:hypothetical protein
MGNRHEKVNSQYRSAASFSKVFFEIRFLIGASVLGNGDVSSWEFRSSEKPDCRINSSMIQYAGNEKEGYYVCHAFWLCHWCEENRLSLCFHCIVTVESYTYIHSRETKLLMLMVGDIHIISVPYPTNVCHGILLDQKKPLALRKGPRILKFRSVQLWNNGGDWIRSQYLGPCQYSHNWNSRWAD